MATEYQPHPASQIFPMMTDSELAELAEDIKGRGLLEPIGVFEGMILDGRNRLAACGLAGIEPRFNTLQGISSPTLYVMSVNLHRRHLTTSQRASIAAEIMPMLKAEAKDRQRRHGGTAPGRKAETLPVISPEVIRTNAPNGLKGEIREIAGKAAGVSGFTISRAAAVQKADPEQFQRIKRGEITVVEAHRQTVKREPAKTQRQGQIENAAKRRMIDVLSHTRGLCRGLAELKISTITGACTPKELRAWATSARESAKQLRAFAALLVPAKETE